MKKIFTLLFIALAMVGCTNHEEKDEIVLPVLNETFYASFADSEELSRTYIDEDIKLLWHADDRISLFRTTLNEEFAFTGETGDNSGGFNAVPSDSWVTGNQVSTNYAVYPYLASTRLSNQEVLTVEMPAVQQYAENSFGRGANTMVAASESSSSRFLPFRNLGGYLVVKLYGEGVSVKSIELVGNNEEVLAGKATVQAKYGYLPAITMSEDGTQSVTLDCGTGVELSADPANPTLFWLVVPPTIFEGGFTLTITNTLGGETIKSTTKKQTIERNGVKSMSAFEVYGGGPRPKNNEIWYTNGSTTEATTPYATDVFGANIVSNTYDADKEQWVIKFDGAVTSIGEKAFYKCSNLTSATISDSVTSIGSYTFSSCTSLTSVIIGNGVTSIGSSAFSYCDSLTSITIPDSVTSIGSHTFSSCTSLTSITIPDSVTSIEDSAFHSCSSLTSVTIPDSVTSIGSSAFYFCTSLKEFKGKFASADNRCLVIDGELKAFAPSDLTTYTIPDSVTSIGVGAFWYCYSLTSVTIPDSVTSIGDGAFFWCDSLTSVTIGNGVTSIGKDAFYACSGLTSITMPDSVTSIGDGAFKSCNSLQTIIIPNSVASIGSQAFVSCYNLQTIIIPNSVTSIGEDAFSHCSGLKEVYCKPTTPPAGESNMFNNNAEGRKIYVPASDDDSIINAYKAADGWKDYADAIEEIKPLNDEIWYTNGSTTKATTPYKTDAFGANIVSNTYDAEKECWVIKFDGEITSIGRYAFIDCTSLTSITIPDSVTSIGIAAFERCTSLTSVTIPDSVTSIGEEAFWDCSSLISITIPDSVTSIGERAFGYCSSLTSITIPDSVTSIGEDAFWDCSSLTSITIPDSVTSIGEGAFCDCSSLTAFYGKFASADNRCLIVDGKLVAFAPNGLTTYTIPDSVTSIGKSAFNGCDSLTSVTIGNGVTSIGYYAFCDCSGLISITIPDSVTSIGWFAFNKCSNLTAFYGKFASADNRCLVIDGVLNSFAPSGLITYTIPDSVTSIGVYAFGYCSSLTSITISDSVTSIGIGAFERCTSLTSVTIGNGVTSIENSAFSSCTSLTSVTIPDSVTSIGDYAFSWCESLKEVYCKPTTPPTGGGSMFSGNASDRKIYVPASDDDSIINAYKAKEYWSSYATSIEEYSF